MPQYCFINDETKEEITIIQKMDDIHEYFGPDGKKWSRIFSVPQASITTDPFNERHFMDSTAKGGNYGSMLDLSKELSERRAEKCDGIDPIRTQKIADSKTKRRGKLTNIELAEDKNKTLEI